MKKLGMFGVLAAALVAVFAFAPKAGEKPAQLEVGAKAPKMDTELTNLTGKKQTAESYKGENGLLVVFSCNTCPFVVAWEDRYNEVYDMAKANNIGMIVVNSNEAKRNGDDSMEMMQKHAKELGYKMPYVMDKNHVLADAFGARTTPHVYLFDKDMKLAYRGAIDDNYDSKKEVKETYLADALHSLAKGEAIATPTTKALGCSIKRVKS